MRFTFLPASLLLILVGCASTVFAPPSVAPLPPFRVVGYFTDADGVVNPVQIAQLTHVNYAFLLPNADGTLQDIANPSKLSELIAAAHPAGVKVLISVGGWGYDAQFNALAANPATRATFISRVLAFVNTHQLDGMDLDWEYPAPGSSAQNFTALINELRAALPRDKLLTAAVAANGANAAGIPANTFGALDFCNIMAYDGGDSTDHSPYSLAQDALAYWSDRGLPRSKQVLGVPFYSRPNAVPYRSLIANNPEAANSDEVAYQRHVEYYNGLQTIQQKTQLALSKADGIMIWNLGQDSTDQHSLLNMIVNTVQASK